MPILTLAFVALHPPHFCWAPAKLKCNLRASPRTRTSILIATDRPLSPPGSAEVSARLGVRPRTTGRVQRCSTDKQQPCVSAACRSKRHSVIVAFEAARRALGQECLKKVLKAVPLLKSGPVLICSVTLVRRL